jgi:hypothetical protein
MDTLPAPRVKVLPPSAFADTWSGKPFEPVRIGLRLVGEDVTELATSRAVKLARAAFADFDRPLTDAERNTYVEAFNLNAIFEVLVHALTDPDDVTMPYFRHAPNHVIRRAFHAKTALMLWEEYERLKIEISPINEPAGPEELESLSGLLTVVLDLPDTGDRRRALRLARALRDEIALLLG